MVICKIWDADYPWDVRVEKVCQSLQQKHEVHLVCRNTKGRRAYENADGIHIHRLPFLHLGSAWLNKVIGFPAFFNPLWIITVWRIVHRYGANLILVRDLPLTLTALLVGRWEGIPVVMDMAENYPAMMQDLWSREVRSKNLLVRNPALVRLIEKICVRYVDHIVAVIEESRERLMDLGVPAKKVSLVMNTPTLERLSGHDSQDSTQAGNEHTHDLNIVYLGLLEWPRGLETAIRAIQLVRTELSRVKLVVIGSGRDEATFKALVARLNLAEQVQFLGWLKYREAIASISAADVGLVPHHATFSWNTTIPNKLFDYMSMGKPVIVSNAKPTERIVREENCGLVFNDRDAKSLAEAVLKLSDVRIRRDLGRRGQEAVIRKYNWAVDEARLFRVIEKVTYSGGLVECVES